jgi:transposase
VRAVCGGTLTGPNPTDRAKRGRKRHLICDGQGVPLAVRLTGANRNYSQEALASSMPFRPCKANAGETMPAGQRLGDRGYDATAIRHGLRVRHILPLLAMSAPRTAAAWAGGAGG